MPPLSFPRRRRPVRTASRRRLFVEPLEDRRLLATYVVDSLSDADNAAEFTLRDAVLRANQDQTPDVIRFADSLLTTTGQKATIQLTEGPLIISTPIVVYGPGADLLTIDGKENGAVFFVQSSDATITGVEVTGGSESGIVNFPDSNLTVVDAVIRGNTTTYDANRGFEGGGGIHNAGNLVLRGSVVSGNHARSDRVFPYGRGGGISSVFGSLEIEESLIFDNSAEGDGGGIYLADDPDATLTNVTLSGNTARLHGGGLAAFGGPVALNHVTVTGNQAADLGWKDRTGGGVFVGTESLTMTNTLVAGNYAGRDSSTVDQPLRSSDVEYRTGFEFRDAQNDASPAGMDLGPVGLGSTRITGRMNGLVEPNSSSGDLHDVFRFTVPIGLQVASIDVSITGYVTQSQVFGDFRLDGDALQHVTQIGETSHALPTPLTAGEHELDLRIDGTAWVVGDFTARIVYGITVTTEPVDAGLIESSGNLIGDPATAAWMIHGVRNNIVGNGRGDIEPIDRILDVKLRDRGGATRVHPLSPNSPAIDAGVAQGTNGPNTDQRGFPYRRSVLNAATDAFSFGIPDIGAFEVQTTPLLMADTVSGTTVWEFMGTSQGGTIDMTVEGVDFSLFVPAGRTSRDTVDALASAIRNNTTLASMGIDAVTDTIVSSDPAASGEKSILITTGEITSFSVSNAGWTHSLRRLQSPPTVLEVSTYRDENDGDYGPGDLSLREAIQLANARPDRTIIRFSQDLLDVPLNVNAGELAVDWDTTIIGLGAGSIVLDAKQSNRLVNISLPASVSMSDLTLTGGKASVGNFGGGAIVNHGDLTLSRVEAIGNETVGVSGGAIANYGTLSIEQSTLAGNTSGANGGGLYNDDLAIATIGPSARVTENQVSEIALGGGLYLRGIVTIVDSVIDANNVENDIGHTAFFGGGVHIDSGSGAVTQVEIRRSYISGNEAIVGAGISIGDTAQVSIVESTVDGNVARAGSTESLLARGGGINVFLSKFASRLEIIGTTISNNKAIRSIQGDARGGGLNVALAGNLHTIANTTISGNEADHLGGGIFVADHSANSGDQVPLEILNTTITNNKARFGAGLFLDGDLFSLVDSILLNNSDIINGGKRDLHTQMSAVIASQSFGPLSGNGSSAGASNNLIHTIAESISTSKINPTNFQQLKSRNYVIAPPDCIVFETQTTLEEILACDKDVQAGAAEAEKQIAALGPLANNGGPTMTHKLRPDSKAIDAGSSNGWRRFNPVDQRGFPRTDSPGVVNRKLATGAPGAAIGTDVGAFEAPLIEVRDWESTTLNSAGGTSVSQFDHSESEDGSPGDPSAFGFGFTVPNAPSIPTEPHFLGLDLDPEPWHFGAIEEGDLGDEYGAEISVDIDTRFGFEYGYFLDTGSVVANYEGLLRYTTEKQGDVFTIDTGNSIDVGALYTVSPRLGAYVDLVAELNAVIEGRACFIGCVGGRLPIRIAPPPLPLLSINRQETDASGMPRVENGNAVLDGDIKLLGVSIDDAFSDYLAEKIADEIKTAQTAKRNAEINKQRAENDLTRETDPDKRAVAQRRLDVANADIKAADASIKEKKKKKQNAADLCIGQIVRGCINETDGGVLGIEASLEAGVGVDGIASVSKPLGSLAISLPEVELTDTSLDDLSGRLSASTDDFLPGSEDDIRRNLAKLSVDVAGVLGPIVGLPLGRYEASVGPITFGVTTLSYNVEPRLNVTQDVSLQPYFDTNDELRSKTVNQHGVKFEFTDANGNPVQVQAKVNGTLWRDHDSTPNRVSEIWFRPGSVVEIDTAGIDVHIIPNVRLGHKLDNNVGLEIDIKGRLEALALQVSAFGETFIDIGPLIKHEHDLGTFDLGSVVSEDDLLLSTSLNATEEIFLDATAANSATVVPDGTQPGNAIESTLGQAIGVEAPANATRYFSVDLIDENGAALESVDLKLVDAAGNPIAGSTLNAPSGVIVTATSNGWNLSGLAPGLGDELLISVRFQNSVSAGTTLTPTGNLPPSVPIIVQQITAERLLAVQNDPQLNQIAVDNDLQIDIDDDAVLSVSSDYVLIERFIKSNNGGRPFSIEHAVSPEAERTTLADIQTHLVNLLNAGRLDVNADGSVDDDDLTLFARYFFSLTTQLPGGDSDGTRTDGKAVESFIAGEVKSPGVDEFTARAEAMAAEAGLTVRRGAGDHFGMKEAFQVDDAAIAGSSAWNPIAVNEVDGDLTFALTSFRTPVFYQDTYVDYTPENGATQHLYVATGAVGTPPQVLRDAAQLVDLAASRGDAFQARLAHTKVTRPTRAAALGVRGNGDIHKSAPVYVMLPDSAGYVFTSDFPVTDLVFDPGAGTASTSFDDSVVGASALDHNLDADGTDIDFDVFVPGHGWFELSMDQPFAFPVSVTSFELYPRALPNSALHRFGNLARPQIEMAIGLVFNDVSVTETPTVVAQSVGPRAAAVQPSAFGTDASSAMKYRVRRDGVGIEIQQNDLPATLTAPNVNTADPDDKLDVTDYPAASLYQLQFFGSSRASDEFVIDNTNGPVSVPILFDAGNDANLGSGGFFEKDVVTLVGSGIVLDLVHEHEIRGVESIDIRGDGSNTLILDEASLLRNSPVAYLANEPAFISVSADADDFVLGFSGWTLTPSQQGDRYESPSGRAVVLVPTGTSIEAPQPAASPLTQSTRLSSAAASIAVSEQGVNRAASSQSTTIVSRKSSFSASVVSTVPNGPFQRVTAEPSIRQLPVNDSLTVELRYDAGHLTAHVPELLGLRVHYDSTMLQLAEPAADLFADGLIGVEDLVEETADGDIKTDRALVFGWVDTQNGWTPSANQLLAKLRFIPSGKIGSTTIRLMGDTSVGYEFVGEPLTMTITPESLIVDSLDDTPTIGKMTLREAIAAANANPGRDIIEFSAALTASGAATLVLTQGDLIIEDPIVIVGPGVKLLTINAQNNSRIFDLTASAGDVTIQQLTLAGGQTPDGESGGAIRSLTSGTLTVSNAAITGSSASKDGGGIFSQGGLRVSDSSIYGNSATNGGGGIAHRETSAIAEVIGSTLSGNNSAFGGGLMNFNATASITNSTISGNTTSSLGGGVVSVSHEAGNEARLTILQSTIARNSTGAGGAVHAATQGGATFGEIAIGNSLVLQQIDGENITLFNQSGSSGASVRSLGHNLVDGETVALGGTGDVTDISVAVIANDLADNGGPTPTHRLLPQSLAIDAADPNLIPNLSTDQRGLPRILGGGLDVGAFELGVLQPGETQVRLEGGDIVTRFNGDIVQQVSRPSVSEMIFHGSAGDETLSVGDLGLVDGKQVSIRFDGHSGKDTYRLLGESQHLDITGGGNTVLSEVEVIDISGSGGNHLTLDLTAILTMSPTIDTVRIQHDENDNVQYGVGWTVQLPEVEEGQFIHVITQSSARLEIVNELPYQNPLERLDTNRDGAVSPLDALVVINWLNSRGPESLVAPTSTDQLSGFFYLDTNGDELVSPIDVLLVVNFLNEPSNAASEGEGFLWGFQSAVVGQTSARPTVGVVTTRSRSDFVVHTSETSGISKSAATTTSAEKRRARRLPFDAKRQSEDDLLSAIDAFFAEIADFCQ